MKGAKPTPRARALAFAALCWTFVSGATASAEPAQRVVSAEPARRVVSMNPSLTATLIALDATPSLVGVEEYSRRLYPEVASLPVVGGLFNPSLEAVVALEPDLVVLVPSAQQRDFRGRLEALGVEVLELPNITVEQILDSLDELGRRVGREEAARTRAGEIRRAFQEMRAQTSTLPTVRTLVVLQRDPLYVVGRGSFIDEMLVAAGAENVAGSFDEPYPRVAVEWAISAGPDLILDTSDDPPDPQTYWSRWPSIPAVDRGRTLPLPGEAFSYPGPWLDRSLRLLADALHGGDALSKGPAGP